MSDPDPRPWWWLSEAERRALGLGRSVVRTARGFLLGDRHAPFRLEILPRDEDAPVKLGSVSLRLHGDASRADARRAIYEAARALHARRGRGYDPAEIPLEIVDDRHHARPSMALAIVDVPTTCDRACAFCHRSLQPLSARSVRGTDADVDRALDRAQGDVLFSGDDALSHPRIVAWIERARGEGRRVSLIGPLPALEPERARELARAGLERLSSGLFGATADVHDAIAGRAGALSDLERACHVLRDAGLVVELVTPLVRPVVPHLVAIVAHARRLTGRPPSLLAYAPDTDVGDALDHVVPPWPELRDALASLGDRGARADALPLCVLPPAWRDDAGAALERTDPELRSVHPDVPCGACAERARCPGVATTVLRAVGVDGLAAIPGQRTGTSSSQP